MQNSLIALLPRELKEETVKYCGQNAFEIKFTKGLCYTQFYLDEIRRYTIEVSCVGIVLEKYEIDVRRPFPTSSLGSECLYNLKKGKYGYVFTSIDSTSILILGNDLYRLTIREWTRDAVFSEIIHGTKSLVDFLESLLQ